jgi:hypothetical protein
MVLMRQNKQCIEAEALLAGQQPCVEALRQPPP